MCLSKVTNWHKKDNGVGYKIFHSDIRTGKVSTPYSDTIIKNNEWHKSVCIPEMMGFNQQYNKGFHIFKTKSGALKYKTEYDFIHERDNLVVHKVKYNKVICSGYQHNKKVIVADNMLVLPEKKG